MKEKVEDLATICGRDDEGDVSELSKLLNAEDNPLQYIKYIYETDVPVSEQRAALRKLAKGARHLVICIEEADLRTRRAIYSAYPKTRVIHEQDITVDSLTLFSRDVEHLRRLGNAIENALILAKVKIGRRGLGHLDITCQLLSEVYKDFSGETFSYDHPHEEEGGREFINSGTRFVAAAAQVMWPSATIANVATSMRKIKPEREVTKTPQKK